MPLWPILAHTIIKSLGLLPVLFTFIGKKINQASAAKKSEKGTKEEDKATGDGGRSTTQWLSTPASR